MSLELGGVGDTGNNNKQLRRLVSAARGITTNSSVAPNFEDVGVLAYREVFAGVVVHGVGQAGRCERPLLRHRRNVEVRSFR